MARHFIAAVPTLAEVARTNTGRRLVERKRLFDAVNTFDGDKKRGLLLRE